MEILTFVELIGRFKGTEDTNNNINHLIEYIYRLQENEPAGDNRSLVNGWQNHKLLTDHEYDNEVQYLIRFITEQFESYLKSYGPTKQYYWGINNLWTNVTPPGGFNRVHMHTGCQFSGIFYLKGSPDAGELILYNPMNTSNLALNYVDLCPRQQMCYSIAPIRNTGAFFSSGLHHRVDINNSKEDRISISFNIRVNDFLPPSASR
ncbi:phytanoyl-CoA-dioxygenase [Cyanophage S-RIM32]|uniref:Phytanoyl-CoA-dioxygenase n=1 Tax=Cyanophage S-RIM32 TaxID=1278479 RepID=A0A127KLT6_9CAUD|nr:2OG-Fe(II) oxygenase [Cyanophage S-RIM32]AMO43052.1 phytanoyl-CoA-dioxygenase [Cyanophage S-RIM32]